MVHRSPVPPPSSYSAAILFPNAISRLTSSAVARWLPDDEAQQFCFEFSVELKRIEALLAA